VCVHGLSGSSRWWSRLLPGLERGGPVVLLDLPRSLHPRRLEEWVSGRLEDLEHPVDLVGHSLGGLVSVRVACLRPELVRRLVLIAPPGIRGGRPATVYLWPLLQTLARSRPGFLARLTTDALRTGPRSIVRGGLHVAAADIRDDLASVAAPTLLVWGALDRIVPAADGPVWRHHLPHARLVVLPGAGHVPMVDTPHALVDAINAFREERLDELGDELGV
jgi:pimeloyl-ACP methyl ester carboxylesterase